VPILLNVWTWRSHEDRLAVVLQFVDGVLDIS